MRSILIIDEDQEVKAGLRESLKKEGFKVYYSDKARAGLGKAREKCPDIILMELAFSDTDGFELIKEIRSDSILMHTALIITSSRSDDLDKVLAFELGADDYIVKPVCIREIIARIKSQFKYVRVKPLGAEQIPDVVLRYGDVAINLNDGETTVNGKKVVLSAKEFLILNMLLDSKGKIVKTKVILQKIWGADSKAAAGLAGVYINNIRRKICSNSTCGFNIKAVGKEGYKVEISIKTNTAV